MIALIKERSRQETYLIQPLIANHPNVVDLSNSALSTVRIVTGVYPDGGVQCIAATYKLPLRSAITNTHGLNCPIDLHTGARITGRRLPDWAEAMELVQKPHQVFLDYMFLGWDIALTPDGPLLLEGNTG